MTQTQLLPEIFKLSAPDQLMIAEAIRNHLLGKVAPESEAKFKAELERRAADADRHPEEESPLEEVMERLRKKR